MPKFERNIHLRRFRIKKGQNFLAQGYYVTTVGRDEATIRTYIQHQDRGDQRLS